MKDRRRRARWTLEIPVQVESDNEVHEGRSLNVGVGGMFLRLAHPPPYGTELTLRLSVPGLREGVRVAAVVRWRAADGVGVQFPSLRPYQVWCLHRLLDAGVRPEVEVQSR